MTITKGPKPTATMKNAELQSLRAGRPRPRVLTTVAPQPKANG